VKYGVFIVCARPRAPRVGESNIRPCCNSSAVDTDFQRQQFAAMSDYSGSPSDHHVDIQPPKRKANQAGLDGHATGRSVKRRASKACQCCRSRKVRCNVTEHGAPCTNCRLDEVECIVSESRRKKLVPHFRAIPENPSSEAQTTLLFDQRRRALSSA
jgi:hypothetical protein